MSYYLYDPRKASDSSLEQTKLAYIKQLMLTATTKPEALNLQEAIDQIVQAAHEQGRREAERLKTFRQSLRKTNGA